MRVRSLAIVMLLALVATAGVIAVRELTRPTPPKAVPPIEVRTPAATTEATLEP